MTEAHRRAPWERWADRIIWTLIYVEAAALWVIPLAIIWMFLSA